MSAIYGIHSHSKTTIDSKIVLSKFAHYNFDVIDEYHDNLNNFYCFHQFITEESTNDQLPFFDGQNKLLITADIILDNRDELISRLSLDGQNISDSQIALEAYKKWHLEFPKYLYGNFAIAIYDYNKKQLVLVRDQMGRRSLYYHHDDNGVRFSTTLEAIIDESTLLNQSYIRKFLGSSIYLDYYGTNNTIYQNIKYVIPATIMVFEGDSLKTKRYWKLKRKPKIHKNFSEEISQKFQKTFDDAIKSSMRGTGEIGILLSGGYDSSSIACKAAKFQTEEEKSLYTYTSVPLAEHNTSDPESYQINESPLIDTIGEMYPNMINRFIDSSGDDPIQSMEELLNIMERPFSFQLNGYWIKNCISKAKEDGCKIILTGQLGNTIYSFTDTERYYFHLFKNLKWKSLNNILIRNCKILRKRRKVQIMSIVKRVFYRKKSFELPLTDYADLDKIEKKEIKGVLDDLNQIYGLRTKRHEVLKKALHQSRLHNMGEIDTLFGLKYGVITRDPTQDIRCVELCHRLGIDFYNYNGYSRQLAKRYMENIVPDEVIYSTKKGIQSGDVLHRIQGELTNSIKSIIENKELLTNYIDVEELQKFIKTIDTTDTRLISKNRNKIAQVLKVLCAIKFLK